MKTLTELKMTCIEAERLLSELWRIGTQCHGKLETDDEFHAREARIREICQSFGMPADPEWVLEEYAYLRTR